MAFVRIEYNPASDTLNAAFDTDDTTVVLRTLSFSFDNPEQVVRAIHVVGGVTVMEDVENIITSLGGRTQNGITSVRLNKMKRIQGGGATPLNLHRYIPVKDVRKLIWVYLNEIDREMVKCAHNSHRSPVYPKKFEKTVISEWHFLLLIWAHQHGYQCTYRCLGYMIHAGSISMLKWLHATHPEAIVMGFADGHRYKLDYALYFAINDRNTHILDWIISFEKTHHFSASIMGKIIQHIIRGGDDLVEDAEFLRWALEKHPVLSRSVGIDWRLAIEYGQSYIVKILEYYALLSPDRDDVTMEILKNYDILQCSVDVSMMRWLVEVRGYPVRKQKWLNLIEPGSEMATWIRSFP